MPKSVFEKEETKRYGNILEVLMSWERIQPNKHLYAFVESSPEGSFTSSIIEELGVSITKKLSYKMVLTQVKLVAYQLLYVWKIKPGERVLLCFPPGNDFLIGFLGCLWAGVIAVPVPAPRPNKLEIDLAKFCYITKDCTASAVLTTKRFLLSMQLYGFVYNCRHNLLLQICKKKENGNLKSEMSWSCGIPWHAIWDVNENAPLVFKFDKMTPIPSSKDIAFLQYTSGSTADPKGVTVTHENLMHNMLTIVSALQAGENTIVVSWLPQFHDMGLIGSCLSLLFCGGSGYYFSPLDFIKDPLLWLHLVSYFKATHLQGPNFAYSLCSKRAIGLQRNSKDKRISLDLSSVSHVFNAAEPVRLETLCTFFDTFEKYGFERKAMSPGYGLAEHTVYVCDGGGKVASIDLEVLEREGRVTPGSYDVVSCGKPPKNSNIKIAIVDSESNPKSSKKSGEVGEIWVSSKSASSSYWDKDIDVNKKLLARIQGGDELYICTGDIGFIDKEGELFVTGRLKDLIVIRGRNHAPEDIEYTIQTVCKSLRPGCIAAISISPVYKKALKSRNCNADTSDAYPQKALHESDDGNDEGLAIVAEVREGIDTHNLKKDVNLLNTMVPRHHGIKVLQLMLLKKGSLPKTSSGKLRRGKIRQMLLYDEFENAIAGKFPIHSGTFSKKKNNSYTYRVRNDIRERLCAIFPTKGYDIIMENLDQPGRIFCLEDRLIAYFQCICDTTDIKSDVEVLEIGIDSLALVQLHGFLVSALKMNFPASVLFQNSSPSSIAVNICMKFEIEYPIKVHAKTFDCHSKMQILSHSHNDSNRLTHVVITAQKSLIWIALCLILYKCYDDMSTRHLDWWQQPRHIFEGPGIEIGFYDRYRDTYHSNFITMYSKTIPLIGLFLILQIGLRIIMDYSISLYIQRKTHPANMTYLESSTSYKQKSNVTMHYRKTYFNGRCLTYLTVGMLFAYVCNGSYSAWFFFIVTANYMFLSVIRKYAYRQQIIWAVGSLFLMVFNSFCYFIKFDDRTYENVLGAGFRQLDSHGSPIGLDISTEYYTRYLVLRIVSFNLDCCSRGFCGKDGKVTKDNLLTYFAYVFYFPLFLRGPSLTYDAFMSQIRSQEIDCNKTVFNKDGQIIPSSVCSSLSNFRGYIKSTKSLLKMMIYVVILEISMHTFYYPTIIFTELDSKLTHYEWTGYAILYLSFMYLQAIISYGIPRVISAFDNIQAPDDMPRCFFAASTSFHSHWRSYHASWNKWFLKYIYLPLGGGYSALWAVCTWSFLLHTFDSYWINWSFITTVALTIENLLKENFKWYKSPNFVVRGFNHAVVAWVHFYIFPGATDKGAMAFAIGILIFMIVFEFSREKSISINFISCLQRNTKVKEK